MRGLRALRGLLAVVLFGGTAILMLNGWLGVGGPEFDDIAGGPLYDAVVLAAAIGCFVRAQAVRAERWAWVLIGCAILCWAAGEIYWTWFILDNPAAPYPSPADIGYLAFYPLAYAGLALLVRARAHELDWRLWTDALIAALGTAALGVAFVFDFIAEQTTGTSLQVATSLAYPLADVAMLAMIVGVIALTGWRPGWTWLLLLAGLETQVVADIAYTLQSTNGAVPTGNWIDPIYLISAVFLGAVVWRPAAATISSSGPSEGQRELVVPAIFAGVMFGLFAMERLSTGGSFAAWLWAATMIAVIARLSISVRENKTLLEQVRTDPLTGLGNRSRMRVDLRARCDRATERDPAALYLFDLNGFKRYNDTCGHPAGDELLAKLGERLADAIGEDGIAYRVGGDEFCVLMTCERERFDPVVRKATIALSARNGGVDVGSAWGGVVIPEDADTPAGALQLADVRMYAQKESRRSARGGTDEPRLTAAS